MLDKLLQDPQVLPEVFDAIRDGLMVVDTRGIIRFFNRAAEEMTGYRKEEIIGKNCSLFHCDQCVVSDGPRTGDPAAYKPVANQRCKLRSRDGRTVHVLK